MHRPLEIVPTADGSPTVRDLARDVTFHSLQGAVGETDYVFLGASQLQARFARQPQVRVLEVGFGTGLNFLRAALAAAAIPGSRLHYRSYEPYPLPAELMQAYHARLPDTPEELRALLLCQQSGAWQNVTLELLAEPWPDAQLPASEAFDVVFFDAFDPKAEPALWHTGLLAAAQRLLPSGVLVTYSVTGAVKAALQAAGFPYERLQGFGRKRHMLRVNAHP